MLLSVLFVALIAFAIVSAWPWCIEATLKATSTNNISLAGGVDVVGLRLSASAAAIVDGPGVVAIHWRAREMWRRSIAHVTLDALLDWWEKETPPPPTSRLGRMATRAKDAVLARTDLTELPELGARVFVGLRDLSLRGAFRFGSSDPMITGKAAAWLYPIASLLAPFGTLDVRFDWSGRNVIDGDANLSVRVVPARVVFEALRFFAQHVHLRRKALPPSTTTLATTD